MKAFDKFGNFQRRDRDITKFVLREEGKSGKERSLSSNVWLEAKLIASSYKDVITSSLFMIAGTDAFLLSKPTFYSRFYKTHKNQVFFSTLVWTDCS